MQNIIISVIKNEDEVEILRDKSSFNYKYNQTTIDLLKKNFKLKDSLYLLATENNDFVAFCSLDREWWEDNYFFIREIMVSENFQRIGIAKQLIEKCIQHAKDKGADGIVTETAFDNYPMQQLCENNNFKKWDNPEWKDGITYKLEF